MSLCAQQVKLKCQRDPSTTFPGLSGVPLPISHGDWKDLLKEMCSWSKETVTTLTSSDHYLKRRRKSVTISKRSFNWQLEPRFHCHTLYSSYNPSCHAKWWFSSKKRKTACARERLEQGLLSDFEVLVSIFWVRHPFFPIAHLATPENYLLNT